ncbi:MAG: extracellular solute-binding protein [Phycisphaeraceae bacterium]|nr:extracellular solute-binding protein [Phycisphaeraceae bacterium]
MPRGKSNRMGILDDAAASLSPGAWIIVVLAVFSTVAVATWPQAQSSGMELWMFSRTHHQLYAPRVAMWNQQHATDRQLHLMLISNQALSQRMMSGFRSGTPVADLIEVERGLIGQVFAGPISDVGFVDLTDRLWTTGLLDRINAPSLSAWTTRGRVFGLPHDVHPVLLAYRADLVEEAGIDVNVIETWDDFARVMQPLVRDLDGDGRPDRFALNFAETAGTSIEALLLQAGGGFFDENDRLVIDSDINARVIATLVTWVAGPDRIAAEAPEFSASGNALRLRGYVVASLCPDWLTSVWKSDLPAMSGKVKLMPLPAWDKGGRRTSVIGGTMLGLTKACQQPEIAWQLAMDLYTAEDVAKQLYQTNGIISPIKELWKQPFYDEPDAYFRGQPLGRLYIQAAPDVPRRSSHPYNSMGQWRVVDAAIALKHYAEKNQCFTVEGLLPEARRLLAEAQRRVRVQMDRNVFLREPS